MPDLIFYSFLVLLVLGASSLLVSLVIDFYRFCGIQKRKIERWRDERRATAWRRSSHFHRAGR